MANFTECLNILCKRLDIFPMTGKKGIQFQFTKDTLKTWLKIIDLSAVSLFSVKFLKDLYLIPCSITFYKTNCLLSVNQSGFIPGDLCVAQLLSIVHEIYKSFNCNRPYDIRGTFLDISKAFDKVWHKGLIFKL